MDICVIGGGYVGLVTAAGLAHVGHSVSCVEIDRKRLDALNAGRLPIHERGLPEMVDDGVARKLLRFTDDLASVVARSQIAIIAVQTPPREDGTVNTDFVKLAMTEILAHAPRGLTVVVKSTVPIGTGDELARLADHVDRDVTVVSNPEFQREGLAVGDFLEPDRIVIGGADDQSIDLVAKMYESIDSAVLKVSRRASELGKYAANSYLASRISFMNEIAQLCDAARIDVVDVEEIIGSDQRIGPHFLKPGLGWGGSCFPKDVSGLLSMANEAGIRLQIISAANEVNRLQAQLAFAHATAGLDLSGGATVGVLGLSFKPNTDDVRESPAVRLVEQLSAAGVATKAYDPVAMPNARQVLSNTLFCDSPYQVAEGVDAVIIATDWPEFRETDWSRIAMGTSVTATSPSGSNPPSSVNGLTSCSTRDGPPIRPAIWNSTGTSSAFTRPQASAP